MMVLPSAARRGVALAATLALAGALLAEPAAAAKPTKCLLTDLTAHRSFAMLQAAVDAASPGDTLQVKGTCVGNATIAKDLTIIGQSNPGFGPATLDGKNAGRVLTISAGAMVALTGLTITNGTAAAGGGIYSDGILTLIRSSVTGNTAGSDGGGIMNGAGALTLRDSIVSDNIAVGGGGGITTAGVGGQISITGASSISRNHAGRAGGGILQVAHDQLTISGTSSVHHNSATYGGGIACGDCDSTWLNDSSSVHHNSATDGGGIYIDGFGQMRFNGASSISSNSATNGGGIFLRGGGATFTGTSSINSNTATTGGGVYLTYSASLSLQDASTISGNIPDNCYPAGTVTGCAD